MRVLIGLEVAHADNDRVRILDRCDPSQSTRKAIDEIFRAIFVASRQRCDGLPGTFVLECLETGQSHRVDLDMVAHDELHSREPDTVGGYPPPAKRRRRVGEVQHDLGARRRDIAKVDLLDRKVGNAFVDESFSAFCA